MADLSLFLGVTKTSANIRGISTIWSWLRVRLLIVDHQILFSLFFVFLRVLRVFVVSFFCFEVRSSVICCVG